LFTPLKFAVIFNSATKVSIFLIDPPKFQFLSIQALVIFFPKMPSTVIPANSRWRNLKTLFFLLPDPKLVGEEFWELGAWRRRRGFTGFWPIFSDLAGFQPVFQISLDLGEILESLFIVCRNHC
jgi:hypothetical protein